jgi:hypothetical protein
MQLSTRRRGTSAYGTSSAALSSKEKALTSLRPGAGESHDGRVACRYDIVAIGCSPTVYKVITNWNSTKAMWMQLLAPPSGILSEHPRQEEAFIEAVKALKPSFTEDSFSWATNAASEQKATRPFVEEEHEAEQILFGSTAEDYANCDVVRS